MNISIIFIGISMQKNNLNESSMAFPYRHAYNIGRFRGDMGVKCSFIPPKSEYKRTISDITKLYERLIIKEYKIYER